MPQTQVAHVANYDFGAPATGALSVAAATAVFDGPLTNDDFNLTAVDDGEEGNDIVFELRVAGEDTPLSVVVEGETIIVNSATDGAGAATSTIEEVINAINGDTEASALVTAADEGASTGADVAFEIAPTNLSGGTGEADPREGGTDLPLIFRSKDDRGGPLTIGVEADIQNQDDLTVSLLVSEDGKNWAATTAPNNTEAVTSVAVKPGASKSFKVILRQGKDNYLGLAALGGGRGRFQVREANNLDIVRI